MIELEKEHFLYNKFPNQVEQNLMIGYLCAKMENKQVQFILMFNFIQTQWIINFQDKWWILLFSNMDRIIWCQIIINKICLIMDHKWWILLTLNMDRIIWTKIISNQICLIMDNYLCLIINILLINILLINILINILTITQDPIISNLNQRNLFWFMN